MKELLDEAANFLKNHPEINEVELEQLGIRVHLIRVTPTPATYTGFISYPFPEVSPSCSPSKTA